MSERNEAHGMHIGRGAWVRFASDAAERWAMQKGEVPEEMRRFGAYLRHLRYRSGHSMGELSTVLGLPVERLLLLEQGLLKPSEVASAIWVRLMRVLEGRESLASVAAAPTPAPAPEPAPVEAARPPAEPEQAAAPAEASRVPDVPVVPERPVVSERKEEKITVEQPVRPAPAPRREAPVAQQQYEQPIGQVRIKVIGVGGGGSNAVARMYRQRLTGIEYVAVNTDAQHLLHIDVPVKLRIGDRLTRGLGVGGNPEIGREAAEESREDLQELLAGTDMVFIACGMGGGTGTGAAPVIAEVAQACGALTIAAVTKPFNFEGRRRARQAEEGILRMREHVDTLIIIPNDRLSSISDMEMTAENAFRLADDVLRQGVQSITDLVTVPGEINLDFADVRTVMKGAGPAWMAIGTARGENRAVEAAKVALASPLLDAPIEGATRVLLNITGGHDMTLSEVHKAANFISRQVDPEANIIFGMVTDDRMEDEVRITVVATGLQAGEEVFEQTLEQMVSQSIDEPLPAADADEGPSEPVVELPGFLRRFGFGRRKDRR
jgi:cell division protein FtsZ